MKKICAAVILVLFLSSSVAAFLYEIKILTKEEIKALKEDELLTLYTDALIEREASQTFHGKAGFSPKEYKSYKELLGLIIRIRQEMQDRKIEPPPITEWLK